MKIIKAFFKGFITISLVVICIMWPFFVFSAIWYAHDYDVAYRAILSGTLCLMLWMLARHNEQLIEDRNHWKQQYNELVGRIFKGEFFKDDKPMFNVGDWVISKVYDFFDLITNYKDGYYSCENGGFPKSYEGSYRLWQLSDAKPGNVLYDKYIGEILLFKGFDNDKINVFCSFSDDKRNPLYVYDEKEYYGKAKYGKNLCPANEIQRKLLFDEMCNLGYELIPDSTGKLNLVKSKHKEE